MFSNTPSPYFCLLIFCFKGNGTIDFQEFMTTLSVSSLGEPEEKLQWAFRMYDMDQNGALCWSEINDVVLVSMRVDGVLYSLVLIMFKEFC